MSGPNVERINFLDCSVIDFNVSIAWSNQATTLTVNLVEDPSIGQSFSGNMGALEQFQIGSWSFWGIITNYRRSKSESGFPVYEVVLADPRDFLNGIQLVIDNSCTEGESRCYKLMYSKILSADGQFFG